MHPRQTVKYRTDKDGITYARWNAEMVFLQITDTEWSGRLVNRQNSYDRWTTQHAHDDQGRKRYGCYIQQHGVTNFQVITRGPDKGSIRYHKFTSLDDAQKYALGWARQRFYVEEVVPQP